MNTQIYTICAVRGVLWKWLLCTVHHVYNCTGQPWFLSSAPNLCSTRVWILGRWSLSFMALCLGRALRRPDYLGEKFIIPMSCWLKGCFGITFFQRVFLEMLLDTKKNHVKQLQGKWLSLTCLSETQPVCLLFYLVTILYFNKEILIWQSAPDMVLNALQIKKNFLIVTLQGLVLCLSPFDR